jgi:YD repeat-containing protein
VGYAYDTAGRLTAVIQNGGTVSTVTYDTNGELHTTTDTTTGQTTTYDYDVLGNLRTVTLPNGTTMTYRTLVQGFFYQDQLRPIAELDETNQVVARCVSAEKVNVPTYMIKGGQTYRIIADHLGSLRLVVDTADGTVAQRLDYDAFG